MLILTAVVVIAAVAIWSVYGRLRRREDCRAGRCFALLVPALPVLIGVRCNRKRYSLH
jgi:hypothetical protein